MQFKFNPITGDLDRVTGNGNYIQKLNPITGKFNLVDDADSYKQIINPLTGNFQLWGEGSGGYEQTVTGNGYIDLTDAIKNSLISLKLFGGTEQGSIPTPEAPADIMSNNGIIKYSQGQIYADDAVETVTVDTTGDTATAEMLLKVGDYADEQEVLSGNIVRRVGIKVLDGTERWNYYSVTQGNLFRIQIEDSVSNAKDTLGVLCNCYEVINNAQRTNGTLSGASKNYDFINNDYADLADWVSYLATQYVAGTPVIIVYPLENPITETVAGQQLNIQEGNNTIEITQAGIYTLELSATYKSTAE